MKKAETISLVSLVTLVIAAVILIGMLNFLIEFLRPNLDNADQVEQFSQTVHSLLRTPVSEEPQSREQFMTLATNQLILFFNTGTEPIFLSHSFIPSEAAEQEDGIQKEHYLRFERPEECAGVACICHCHNGREFWSRTDAEPYLEGQDILLSYEKDFSGYSCAPERTTCATFSNTQPLVFANSRGVSESFAKQEAEFIADERDERNQFTPIMLDIVLMTQNKFRDDGNIFFSTTIGDNYNYRQQNEKYVYELLANYYWEGGVVLGGSGLARTDDDFDDHFLRPVPLTIQLEKHDTSSLTTVSQNQPVQIPFLPQQAVTVIGVCTFQTAHCLNEESLPAAVLQGEEDAAMLQYSAQLDVEHNKYYSYLHATLRPQLASGKFDKKLFFETTAEYFTRFPSTTSPTLTFQAEGQGTSSFASLDSLTTESRTTPLPYFRNSEGELAGILTIIGVDTQNELLIVPGGTFQVGYDTQTKSLQLIEP